MDILNNRLLNDYALLCSLDNTIESHRADNINEIKLDIIKTLNSITLKKIDNKKLVNIKNNMYTKRGGSEDPRVKIIIY